MERVAEPAACRGRVPRPWNDVTLIRPFERVTLARFSKVTGGPIQAEPFYDDVLSFTVTVGRMTGTNARRRTMTSQRGITISVAMFAMFAMAAGLQGPDLDDDEGGWPGSGHNRADHRRGGAGRRQHPARQDAAEWSVPACSTSSLASSS